MGQKHSHDKKIHRHDTLTINRPNIFDDAVDLEEEAEQIKIGNKKSMTCPNCNKFFKTTNRKEIEAWVNHRRSCKKKNSNKNTNNIINPNQNNRRNNIPPPPPLNFNNNNSNNTFFIFDF